MSVIRVLPPVLANKIAAGEVVERPASVVRELVENSIDAGATRIKVEVMRGGRAMIRVSDNGHGMDAADARLCVERHATSKLADDDALFHITTMGFRGEALPSIASVSRMHIVTAPGSGGEGMRVELEGGVLVDERPAPCVGTTVEVLDLFYNTPARRKFLKRESTELMHVTEAVTSLALSHPEVAFTLMADGRETMATGHASGLRERVLEIYGREFMETLVHVTRPDDAVAIEALLSHPRACRDRRTHQYIFINRRPVRDPSISHALYAAYEGLELRGRHPVYFLNLTLDPGEVDFNVHPAKREVRLAGKEAVYRITRGALAMGLRGPEGAVETVEVRSEDQAPFGVTPPADGEGTQPAMPFSALPLPRPRVEPPGGAQIPLPAASAGEPSLAGLATGAAVAHVYLGGTFVAYPDAGGLAVMDHHAAHERVLYERLLDGLRLDTRQLLFPRQVKLSPKEHLVILGHRAMLHEFGIEVDDFGHGSVVVRSLPDGMEQADLRGILSDAAAAMAEGQRPGRSLREGVAARIACHASVRGSTVLSPEAFNALREALAKARDPWHCPHGRPTVVRYSADELRRMFGRA
jgi:DNA mismatch repair protein MutL